MRSLYAVTALAGLAIASPFPEAVPELEERKTFTCPPGGDLSPNYVKPSLFVEVSKKEPDCKFGATKRPFINPDNFGVIVNLDLPPSAWDKVCNLVVLFPNHHQTKNYYYYSGGGHFHFTGYATGVGATLDTTYNHQPAPGPSPPSPPFIGPGNAYSIFQAPCNATGGFPDGPNTKAPVTVSGLLESNDTTWAFQNSPKKCALGFFVELL